MTGTDAQTVRPYIIFTRHECPLCQGDTCNPLRCYVGTHGRVDSEGVRPRQSKTNPVGTHGLCVRCVKGYSVKVLTRTDARLCLVGGRPLSNDMTCNRDTVIINGDGRTDRASLQGIVTASGVRCVKAIRVTRYVAM